MLKNPGSPDNDRTEHQLAKAFPSGPSPNRTLSKGKSERINAQPATFQDSMELGAPGTVSGDPATDFR
ncbi:hypothetical protein GCM10007100_09950 [Roseibacillus persicicus]|uniref:Uncharacterized protein n=1 Tax=Roseibacillus persicicus TaxID=454148 RepID=A0A918THB5_9BACT|nr:hypothetical protein GCM10007100_09950 [Roseibacillus persicicus]